MSAGEITQSNSKDVTDYNPSFFTAQVNPYNIQTSQSKYTQLMEDLTTDGLEMKMKLILMTSLLNQ